jgi:excisionase family DNA binding protein
MNEPLSGEWVTQAEAARYLRVSTWTIRKWAHEGKLVRSVLGHRTVLISSASVEKLVERSSERVSRPLSH